MAERDELLHPDQSMPTSEPAVVTAEVASRSMAGAAIGMAVGAVIGLVIGAALFGFSGDDAVLSWICLIVGAFAGAVPGFVFGGGRGVRDGRRQAEAEARPGR
jgi:hypothetical protein